MIDVYIRLTLPPAKSVEIKYSAKISIKLLEDVYNDNFESGLFSAMKKELNSAASSISKEMDSVSKKASDKWDEHATSPLLDNFRTNNVIQLVSRSSGRTLEIVTAHTGQLVVDGCGPEGPTAPHAHWTVQNDGKNIVRLRNQNNYVAIVQGAVVLMNFPDPSQATRETRFRLHQKNQFVCLESDAELGRHLGVMNTGMLKSAMACGTEIDGQWGVRLIYTPYQAYHQPKAGQPVNTTQVVKPGPGGSVVVTTTTTRKQ